MLSRKLLQVLFAAFCLFTVASAQTPSPTDTPDAQAQSDKQKKLDESIVKMLDQAIADAGSLRLAENRAIVYGLAGDIYWKYDNKRARDLFRSSAQEMISYNAEAEKNRLASTDTSLRFVAFDPFDPRSQILPIIAQHDAPLALELLYQTRPPAVAAAMAKESAQGVNPANGGGRGGRGGGGRAGGFGGGGGGFGGISGGGFDPDRQLASMESVLEQRLIALAAGSDPDLAVKTIKDQISNGVSTNVIGLLQKLSVSDSKKAADLGSDVIKKVADGDFAENQQDLNTALSFLSYAAKGPVAASSDPKDKPFVFDDSQMKDLGNKVVNALMQMSKTQASNNMINRALPTLQKIVPDKASLLSQQMAATQTTPGGGGRNGMANLYNANTTPEDILSSMGTMTAPQKTAALSALTSKIGQITDDARAQKLIDQIPDDKAKQSAQEAYNDQKAARATAAGKLDDARAMIGGLSNKHEQIKNLVALAITFQARGGDKDLENAKATMAQAKGMVNPSPEDEDEIADLMEVVNGYAVVNPDIAFRLFEPVVDQFNEIVQAEAVLSKYNKRDRTFSKGEMVMRVNGGPSLLPFRYISQMQNLGKANFDRMSALADHFSRSDARTIVRLYILQGATRDDKKTVAAPAAAPAPSPGVGSDF